MNSQIGVHGCSLVGVERPTVFGTVLDCMVGSTVLTAVGKFTIWVAASVAVEVPTSKQLGWDERDSCQDSGLWHHNACNPNVLIV